jgi:hypothetical protein
VSSKLTFALLSVILIIICHPTNAQIGGDNTYEFLNLTSSARIASMGGDFLTIYDNDIMLVESNPSLINPNMSNKLGVAYVDFFSDVNYGTATYAKSFSKVGNFAASVKYISYGTFDYASVTGERTGQFNAGETAFNVGWGRQLDSLFSIGANLKFIYSSLESYNSFGLAVDVAGSYISRDRSFTVSLIAKNIGRQITAYEGSNIEPLPFELQIGMAKKLKHLPFRYSILYNNIERWDLRYDDPGQAQTDPITGEVVNDSGIEVFADNLMLHLVFGGELLIGKNISLRGGYNYRRRQEMKVTTKPGTVGFSWGIGIRISKFHISYARSAYHLSGSPNYFTLTTNLSDFFVKKN